VKLAYELAKGAPPPPVIWGGMYNYITGGPWGAVPVLLRGSPFIRERYFDRLMTAKYSTCIALTDPGAGSDPQNMTSTAMRDGDNYVINGHKRFVGNGPYADFYMVYARTSGSPGDHRGISMIMVDRGTPGFEMIKVNRAMEGLGNHAELRFQDCVVPAENLVGDEGGGFFLALEDVSLGRLIVGAKCLGIADWLLEQAVARAKEHKTFGVALAQRQAIQWMLAEAATENELLRNMLFSTAWKLDEGQSARRDVAMVKLTGPRAYAKSADVAIQIFGGLGYLDDYPFGRAYRQSRGLRIIEGSDEMQLRAIATSLLKD
jgi:alkylation response protein AidB-like acyl-CoA dehydrogenase